MWLFLKNALFTVVVPGTVGVTVPLWLALRNGAPAWPPWGGQQIAALVPLTLGAAVYFWCLWNFATAGHGTPAPIDPPRCLVIRGLYRHVRNPMYLGVLAVIVGWTVFFASGLIARYAAGIALMFYLIVLIVEEPVLRRQFGADYERYCHEVRRWLPRLRAARVAPETVRRAE